MTTAGNDPLRIAEIEVGRHGGRLGITIGLRVTSALDGATYWASQTPKRIVRAHQRPKGFPASTRADAR